MPNPHQSHPDLDDIRTQWEDGYSSVICGYFSDYDFLSILKDVQGRYYIHHYQNPLVPEIANPHSNERLGWCCHILAYQVYEDELIRFIIGERFGK